MKMKKLLFVVFMLGLSGLAYGQFTGDGPKNTILSTPHDLRSNFTGATAVCEYCHMPHKYTTLTNQPPLLWNVQVKSGPYSVYSSSTMNATPRDPSTASSTNSAAYYSLLCLSCHDGTVALTSFYFNMDNQLGTAGSVTPPNIGSGGLANDHPVDFTYSAALASADGGVKSPTEGATVKIPYVGTTPFPLFKDQPTDTSGRLECATCHNPHKNTNGDFLRMSNTASGLCLNCHS